MAPKEQEAQLRPPRPILGVQGSLYDFSRVLPIQQIGRGLGKVLLALCSKGSSWHWAG